MGHELLLSPGLDRRARVGRPEPSGRTDHAPLDEGCRSLLRRLRL
jgi:hypothetical protein